MTPVRQVHEEQAHECNENSTEIEPVQVPSTASSATLDQHALPDLSKEEGAYKSESVKDVIKNIIHYCMEHQVSDPVEILRYYQKEMVIGTYLRSTSQARVFTYARRCDKDPGSGWSRESFKNLLLCTVGKVSNYMLPRTSDTFQMQGAICNGCEK